MFLTSAWCSPRQRVQWSFHPYQRCTFVSETSCGVRKWDLSRPQGKVRPERKYEPRLSSCNWFVPPCEMIIIGKASRDLRLLDNVLSDEVFKTDWTALVPICKRISAYYRRKRIKERRRSEMRIFQGQIDNVVRGQQGTKFNFHPLSQQWDGQPGLPLTARHGSPAAELAVGRGWTVIHEHKFPALLIIDVVYISWSWS